MWLRQERNELFTILRDSGADPVLFVLATDERTESRLGTISRLVLSARDEPRFMFVAEKVDGRNPLRFIGVPVRQIGVVSPSPTAMAYGAYDDLIIVFKAWCKADASLWAADLTADDLWQNVATIAAVTPFGSAGGAEERLSADEKDAIRKGLVIFGEQLRERYRPNAHAEMNVARELARLTDAVERLERRVDWRGLAIGALVNIATALALAPDQLQALGALFASSMSAVFRLR